ncbi:MAG: hypothetical protein HY675_00350 [Chloroflexi bacterium]|nr:hypothetical protein [Chloroflexota bacterium]
MEKYVKADGLDGTGRLLGTVRGGVFVFDSENETNAFMDFALFEYRTGKKNAIELYREEIGGKDEREKEILDAFVSYAST